MAILFSVTRCGTLATLWALCEYDFKWIMYKSERNVFVQAKKSHLIFGCSIKMTFNWFLGKKVDRSIIFTPLGLLLGYFCEILGVFVQPTWTLWFYSSHSLILETQISNYSIFCVYSSVSGVVGTIVPLRLPRVGKIWYSSTSLRCHRHAEPKILFFEHQVTFTLPRPCYIGCIIIPLN